MEKCNKPMERVNASSPRGGLEFEQEYICWTRMQAEAGQTLDAIVRRKELERRAGNGMFLWGVGNAPAIVTNELARLEHPVTAVFSIMKSRPKAVDSQPGKTVAWRRYVAVDGGVRPLPPHVLVTSRAESATGPKSKHFALMCWSDKPLAIRYGEPFDPSAFRNAGAAGAPVGASQVTALLRRISRDGNSTSYEVNLRSKLVGAYWTRLLDPAECPAEFSGFDKVAAGSIQDWLEFVSLVRKTGDLAEQLDGPKELLL
ncbi:MAG: hypothetical protein Q8M31_23615 [Beijerinckiaceae bacterium]|nr:hypothetical protein [Beijerinckiaceae bacterium]